MNDIALSRKNAILTARCVVSQNPLYLDTETTGTGSDAEIVELAIIDSGGNKVYDGLIKPLRRVPLEAYNVHHIGDTELANAPLFREAWPDIGVHFTQDKPVVIYNADFDARIIRQCYDEAFGNKLWIQLGYSYSFNPFCAMKLYAQFYGELNRRYMDFRWQSLEKAGVQCGINLPNSHRAADDAKLARAIMHYMASQEA